jgi:chromate transporter
MIYLQLYFAFLRIGLFTFGGGYAMLPMMERVICEKKQWATREELTDVFAVGQAFPGILAVNTATFIGNKLRGVRGGIAAALGMITPSLTIVTLIALFFDTFMEIELVRNALSGIFAAACALIVAAVYKLFKTSCLKSAKQAVIPLLLFAGAFSAIAFAGITPVLVVAVTAALGVLVSLCLSVRGGGEKT